MTTQVWIFSVRYYDPQRPHDLIGVRRAVVGPARTSTIEAALQLASVPEAVRAEIRACDLVRTFVEGRADPDHGGGYYHAASSQQGSWAVCVGSVHEVLEDKR